MEGNDKKRFAYPLDSVDGLLFDYGATLDTAGTHWGKAIWHACQACNVPVSEDDFRKAYVYAERTLGSQDIVQPQWTFRQTLAEKIRLEMGWLAENGMLQLSGETRRTAEAVHALLYRQVEEETARSRKALAALAGHFRLGLVSNFYGNIRAVLAEFSLDAFFPHVVESAAVGIRKPDQRLFTMGAEAMGTAPGRTAVVGDSIDKDIAPAKAAGMKAVWVKGEAWKNEGCDETLPDLIINNVGQLLPVQA